MKFQRFLAVAALCAAAGLAHANEIVVVGHPSAAAMTREQVSDLFLGKGGGAVPVDQSEASPLYADFYRRATGRDVPQVKATWSRLVFTGKAQAPRQLADSSAVKKAVAADPKAVGYIERAAVDSSVKVLLSLN